MAYTYKLAHPAFLFHSAHFIVTGKDRESMHGHSYRVEVEISSKEQIEKAWLERVADEVAKTCKELHCKFILPLKTANLKCRERDEAHYEVEVWGKSTYIFPKSFCAPLPIEYSSAEMLSWYLSHRISRSHTLASAHLTLRVYEKEHQQAACISRL